MKQSIVVLAALSAIALPLVSMAATSDLTNGGLGQSAGNMQSFGVAVCNSGGKATTQSVQISVTANGETVTIPSAASIKPGACAYSYLDYSQLGMQTGGTYTVTATLDTSHVATYSVTVPGGNPKPVAVAGTNANVKGTANVNAQSGNFFTDIANWFSALFGGK